MPGSNKELQIPLDEEEFDTSTFNPFDRKEQRKTEDQEKPMKPRKVYKVKGDKK